MRDLSADELKALSGLDLSFLQELSVERLEEYIAQYSAPGFRLNLASYFSVDEWLIILRAELASRKPLQCLVCGKPIGGGVICFECGSLTKGGQDDEPT